MIFSPVCFRNIPDEPPELDTFFWMSILSVIYSVCDPSGVLLQRRPEIMNEQTQRVGAQSILSFIQE